jgi:hypothetical protein
MKFLIASALLLSLAPAMAQGVKPPGYDPRTSSERPARDGCVNQPGVPHNSADCSRIPASDYNTVVNSPATDLAGRPTGATENAERNRRILSGQSSN